MSQLPKKDLSLKSLELFEICARKGSLQAAADEAGLAVSTISHHLRNLEDHLGVALFDHGRRPLILTGKGQAFLSGIEDALLTIRRAKAEASSGGIVETSHLRIGSIADFDSDIMPELAVFLSKSMANCRFAYQSGVSNAIIEMLRSRQLELGIAASPGERIADLKVMPLLQDPFVVVVPKGNQHESARIVENKTELPMLRFSRQLMIGRQIEAHFRRSGLPVPRQFECDNNQTLMAMVAGGAGWAVTTPLLYSRATRFHRNLEMRPFPGRSFSRSISVLATPDCSEAVLTMVDRTMRRLIGNHALKSIHRSQPWLEGHFKLLD